MARYIDENDVYKLFNARGVAYLHVGDIDALPRADAKEVVHGWWESASPYMLMYRCSICKKTTLFSRGKTVTSNYCPNCGAKMDLEG